MGLLRLLLALAVVAAHAGPPGGAAWLQMTGGPTSVQIFFVISGFYMTLVLTEKYVGPGAYAAFARSRLLRLVPMFLAVLGLTVLVAFGLQATTGLRLAPLARWQELGPAMPWGDWLLLALTNVGLVGQDLVSFFAVDPVHHELFFTPDFHHEAVPAWQLLWVPQAWSLSVELMFYALAPLLVRRRPWLLAAMVLASLALRVHLMRHYGVYHDPWTYRFFPTELALFLSGALACHGYRWAKERRLLRPWVGVAATGLLLLGVVGFAWLPPLLQHGRFGLAGLLALVPLLLPFAFHLTRDSRFDRALGELSYPVYLVHFLLVFVIDAVGVAWLSAARGLVVMVGSLLLAVVLWRCIGRPLEARRQRLAPAAPANVATGPGVGAGHPA